LTIFTHKKSIPLEANGLGKYFTNKKETREIVMSKIEVEDNYIENHWKLVIQGDIFPT